MDGIISISIPEHYFSLVSKMNISSMSNEDKCIALLSGVECMNYSKKMLAIASERDIYNEVERGFRSQLDEKVLRVETLESELNIERKLADERYQEVKLNIEREVDNIVRHRSIVHDRVISDKDSRIEYLTDKIRESDINLYEMRETIRKNGLEFQTKLNEEVNERVRLHKEMQDEKMRNILEKNNEVMESMIANNSTKTSTQIGVIGENQFVELAEKTFVDFSGFHLEDVHNQPHKGDAHIVVKDLTIMVDAKAYKRKVDLSQIDKIKSDLRRNEHIHFAWLVSLNTNIDRRDGAVFVFEWISEEQCVVHVNNLMSVSNRELILKTIFYICRDHYNRIKNGKLGNNELISIRESHRKVVENVSKLKKRLREVKTSLNGLRNLHDELEKDIVGLLNEDANLGANKYYALVYEWWNEYMEECANEKTKSTVIWTQFKRENDEICKELDVGTFKDVLCMIVPEINIVKSKSKAGAMELIGYRMKSKVLLKVDTTKP